MAKILESTKERQNCQTVYLERNDCFIIAYKEQDKYIIKDGKIIEIIIVNIRGDVKKGNVIRTENGDYAITMISKSMIGNKKVVGEKI